MYIDLQATNVFRKTVVFLESRMKKLVVLLFLLTTLETSILITLFVFFIDLFNKF